MVEGLAALESYDWRCLEEAVRRREAGAALQLASLAALLAFLASALPRLLAGVTRLLALWLGAAPPFTIAFDPVVLRRECF